MRNFSVLEVADGKKLIVSDKLLTRYVATVEHKLTKMGSWKPSNKWGPSKL